MTDSCDNVETYDGAYCSSISRFTPLFNSTLLELLGLTDRNLQPIIPIYPRSKNSIAFASQIFRFIFCSLFLLIFGLKFFSGTSGLGDLEHEPNLGLVREKTPQPFPGGHYKHSSC